MATIITSNIRKLNISRDGTRVIVSENGSLLFTLPWDAALALSSAIRQQAKLAEEESRAVEIVRDQSILFKNGIPLALSSRHDILTESAKSAGGIPSQGIVGVPRIIKSKGIKE